ncbi:MAG: ribosome small subunit-dependent GTPase A [Spirochaetales bacterium]
MTGTIHWGINNIFAVRGNDDGVGQDLWECRLKGKVLKDAEDEYNPLSPGDRVDFEPDPDHAGKGMISARQPRTNAYSRWNKKRNCPQTLAANLDLLVLVTSPVSPPFRPRFLDRALLMAGREDLEVLIVVNKCDQGVPDDVEDRLAEYQDLGFDVHLCSSQTGEGITELQEHLKGLTSALVGQSGVGKSSLLNVLHVGSRQKVGELSAKHNRGNHTTNFSLYYPWDVGSPAAGGLIDTPGVRELEVFGIEAAQLAFAWPEFAPFLGQCGFNLCSHTKEPGCAVLKALESGDIHPDRWDNYQKLYLELQEAERRWT